jgi:hypothetical protein
MAEEPATTSKKVVGKRSLPKNAPRPTGEVELYAGELKDKQVGNLKLKYTDNAWWADIRKVEKLVDALKIQCTIEEAIVYAGISRHQYYYFLEHHPDFSYIKEACEKILVLKARQNVASKIEADANASYAFLQDYERKKALRDAENRPVKPNAVQFVDFGEPLPPELRDVDGDANQDDYDYAESE